MSMHLEAFCRRSGLSSAVDGRARRVSPASGAVLVGLLAMAGAAACASPGPSNPANLAPTQLGQIHDICRSVIGIPGGTGLSVNCVESLSESVAALGQGQALADARHACLGKGLTPGQPALSECELSTVSTKVTPGSDLASRIDTATSQPPAKSYFYASSREIRRREQVACARLGYDPIYSSFTACVASLDQALFAAEHSSQ